MTGVEVTDHALVKYLEIVMGLDIERMKRLVLPFVVERQALKVGDGVFPTPGRTHRAAIRGGRVVTVFPSKVAKRPRASA